MKPRTLAQMIAGQNVLAVTPETAIRQACVIMATRNIGALPVINDRGSLLGMISERDVIKRSIIVYRPSAETKVGEVMSRNPQWLPPDAKPRAAANKMWKGGFRHLPVCDDDKLVGMISVRDFDARGKPISRTRPWRAKSVSAPN